MAMKSGFFNSVNGDRKYKADFFSEYFANFIGNGIFPNPSSNFQVIANNNMTVTLAPGKAWINGVYCVDNLNFIIPIQVADGVLNRIDRVVLRLDTVTRDIQVVVKKGAFASSPVAPALQRNADAYELGIADIYVSKGAISITQANLTDLRLNNSLCGIVHGTVDQVDTTTLFNQYLSWFQQKQSEFNTDLIDYKTTKQVEIDNYQAIKQQEIDLIQQQFQQDFDIWFLSIKDILDTNTAGNLLNMISAVDADLQDYKIATDAQMAENMHKKVSSVRPTNLDDVSKGFNQGDIWIYESYTSENDYKYEVYQCLDSKENVAKWSKYTEQRYVDDKTNSPGPKILLAGTRDAGFFGIVPASELFTGVELSLAVGITEGISQFNDIGWLKFSINGKIIFKSQKTFRHSISWDHINSKGCSDGSKVVTKNDTSFRVRLMKGSSTDPCGHDGTNYIGAKGSEWNRLMIPIHVETKDKSWKYPENVESDIPYWGIDLTDIDLHVSVTAGNGSYQWCQERIDGVSFLTSRLDRGRIGVSMISSYVTNVKDVNRGWSPVLEVIES